MVLSNYLTMWGGKGPAPRIFPRRFEAPNFSQTGFEARSIFQTGFVARAFIINAGHESYWRGYTLSKPLPQ